MKDPFEFIKVHTFALLVTTAKKTQVITGPAPEKAGRIRAVCS